MKGVLVQGIGQVQPGTHCAAGLSEIHKKTVKKATKNQLYKVSCGDILFVL